MPNGPTDLDVLVVDVGGSHVKMLASGASHERRFDSRRDLSAEQLVEAVLDSTGDWSYDVVSIGYPGSADAHGPRVEPGHLGDGWVGFDFETAFGRPVRLVNDAVMQALGGYDGGRMLFLGLGTGLGSALVSEHVIVPLELGSLPYRDGQTMADYVGRRGLERHGEPAWLRGVHDVATILHDAIAADYIVLGGGNAVRVDPLPAHTRRGSNEDAFVGGFRLWEEVVEPHDQRPPRAWRVLR